MEKGCEVRTRMGKRRAIMKKVLVNIWEKGI